MWPVVTPKACGVAAIGVVVDALAVAIASTGDAMDGGRDGWTAPRPRPHRTILVTGFGAFPGMRRNPTATILRDLDSQRARFARLGIALRFAHLPVRYAAIGPCLSELMEAHRPDAILHLGVAGRRRVLSVETRALNRAGPLHPDASWACPPSRLVTGGPMSLRATYPAVRIRAALKRAGFDARLSNDAGDYVCNATLYRSLDSGAAAEIGFLHVPRVRKADQPSARTLIARPASADLTKAVVIALLAMIRPSLPLAL